MAAVRTHTTAQGFCLCHLLCVWRLTARLGLYFGYYNVSYAPLHATFVCDEQLYVQLMMIFNLLGSVAYLWFSQRWVYDPLIFLLYVPLYIYFVQLRQYLTKLLNACCGMHQKVEQVLGAWLCVSAKKECLLALLLPVELLLILLWHCRLYYSYQFCFIAGIALGYYIQLLFLGNYLIWLTCIYRALNGFLVRHMSSSRIGILRTLLRQHSNISGVHSKVIRYFSLHLLSFVVWFLWRLCQLVLYSVPKSFPNGVKSMVHIDRLQLLQLVLLLALLLTLLIIAFNLQKQRWLFRRNFLLLEDRLEYFQLKSWRLLRHQTLPMPFGLPLLRSFARTTPLKRDVISMLFSSNLPVSELGARHLPLASLYLGPHHHQLTLTLPLLLASLIKVGFMVLVCLCQHWVQHSHIEVNLYSCYIQGNFDANVTQTISQVYRWYAYDELE